MITLKDIKAAMTYSSVMAETLQVAGYSIEIMQDSDCSSPYECAGMAPALWLSGYRHGGLQEFGAASLESFFDRVTHGWISRHWRAIATAMDMPDLAAFDAECREHAAHYSEPISEARFDLFSDFLGNMRAESCGDGLDYLECLKALYTLARIPAETFQRNGYSQGDSVYGLIVMTPEWAAMVGAPHATPGKVDKAACDKDMESQADEYGAWCWGDCYGYRVTDAGGDDVDSCWGFIASDGGEYMLGEIVDCINHDMQAKQAARLAKQAAKQAARLAKQAARLAKVKDLIRARVPLPIRRDIMAAMPI